MKRMQKRNLNNIKRIFEEKTGVELEPSHPRAGRPWGRRALVLAAVIGCSLLLLGFGNQVFSYLDADDLALSGSYLGNGIVSVYVENRSDKELQFQEKTKLMRWITSKEVERTGGSVTFTNTEFPPHSSGYMTVDLSEAYDIAKIEARDTQKESYYLILTNHDFLFGHDWICSVTFGAEQPEAVTEETAPVYRGNTDPPSLERIEPSLQFYFEETYQELIAFNENNFRYQEKVEAALRNFDGNVIPSLSPVILVGGPSQLLDPEPKMEKPPAGTVFDDTVPEEEQYLLTMSDWSYVDGYGRMVATHDEKAWVQTAMLPSYPGQTDGGVAMPLIFLFVYDAQAAAQKEDYVFLYGQFLSFGEMEAYKVLEDEHYAVYDATDLIYTDLDAYLEYFLTTRSDIYCDDQIRQRVRNIYEFYQDKNNIQSMYRYFSWE